MVERPKMGFGIPGVEKMKGSQKKQLSKERIEKDGIFDYERYFNGEKIWTLFMWYERWM